MTKLYFLKHSKSWLNVDQSLNIDLFYEDIHYLIEEGNEILAKEIIIFYKELSSTIFNPPRICYKNMTSFSYNTNDFPPLTQGSYGIWKTWKRGCFRDFTWKTWKNPGKLIK